MWIEMQIDSLLLDTATDQPVLMLSDLQGRYRLPLALTLPEAGAIASELESIRFDRPMTHDLLNTTIQSLGAKVVQVAIHSVWDQTFHAVLRLDQDGRLLEVDARPGDALALAVRCRVPILISPEVLAVAAEPIVEVQRHASSH